MNNNEKTRDDCRGFSCIHLFELNLVELSDSQLFH